jgi:small GTP-binding protein
MINDQQIQLRLWNTKIQDGTRDRLRPLCCPQTDIFLLVYSIANPDSFENITQKWVLEIKRHMPDTPFVLVGTKIDLRDDEATQAKLQARGMAMVSTEQGQQLAAEIGAQGH